MKTHFFKSNRFLLQLTQTICFKKARQPLTWQLRNPPGHGTLPPLATQHLQTRCCAPLQSYTRAASKGPTCALWTPQTIMPHMVPWASNGPSQAPTRLRKPSHRSLKQPHRPTRPFTHTHTRLAAPLRVLDGPLDPDTLRGLEWVPAGGLGKDGAGQL